MTSNTEAAGSRRALSLVAVGALLLIYLLWLGLAARHPYLPGDIEVTLAVQQATSELHGLFAVVTWAGANPAAGVLAALTAGALWIRGAHREGATLVLGTVASTIATEASRVLIHQPRPSSLLVQLFETYTSAGFPSGHTVFATVFYGYLAYLAMRRGRWRSDLRWDALAIVCLLLILLTGLDRIAQGAHWPSQVLGGLYLGSMVLALMVWITNAPWRHASRTIA